jgi:predicted aspartyl protease
MEPVVVEPKPGVDVGRIVVDMHVENASDLTLLELGKLPADAVRSIDVQALVYTGSTYTSLTSSDIARLGLRRVRQRQTRAAAGPLVQQIWSAVRITVEDRDCLCEVVELPDDKPALLGLVPLTLMDFWIDTANRRLAVNPEHGGRWMIDCF